MNQAAVSAIENNCVAEKTKDRYNSGAYQFIMWLYKNRETSPDVLRPRVVEQMEEIEGREGLTDAKKTKLTRKLVVEGWLKKMERTDPTLLPCRRDQVDV